ncbi:hypothetical protein [uncultured Roseobacter sp.]|uniref:hypothetical protein n=1 Tax=uncultured Roseobacter sp. TaxID=114847 RepID=UPI00260ACC73|nr:hypothetical protein [uncultured Roseobacter sp.]
MKPIMFIGIAVAISVAIAASINIFVVTPPATVSEPEPSAPASTGFYGKKTDFDTTDGEGF